MNKADILQEIKRTAGANGGVPLGERRFIQETGIGSSYWHGGFWARFNDAVREAGYTPRLFTTDRRYESADLLGMYAKLAASLGRLPSLSDLRLKARNDPEFPNEGTFNRFGNKADLVARLAEHCRSGQDFGAILRLCEEYTARHAHAKTDQPQPDNCEIGFVYLVKSGRYYKIGRTNNPIRREGEVGIQLPEKLKPVHYIKTDDPSGIESYWHSRFAAKRMEGEWFALTAEDVRAFKRWKRIY